MSAGLVRGFLYFEKSSDESPMIELSVIKMVEWNKFSFSTRVSMMFLTHPACGPGKPWGCCVDRKQGYSGC